MPTTNNIALIVPNTGDLVGAWGTSALNPNFVAIDGMFGGFETFSLSSATTIALSAATGSLTPGAGPYGSQNALLKFTGTLTGNAVIQIPRPGFYIVDNRCTVGSFYVQMAPSAGPGTAVGAPPGQKVHIFYDGTDVDYVDMPPVGSALDLHNSAGTVPAWMSACSVAPYLVKDGTLYASASYPQLSAILGSTYGGNGVTTFGVPDERARVRIALDNNPGSGFASRVTTGVAGFDATTMGASGGDQAMQSHTHTLTDPGHFHVVGTNSISGGAGAINILTNVPLTGGTTAVSTTGITIAANGSGSAQNMQPSIVNFVPLIKT